MSTGIPSADFAPLPKRPGRADRSAGRATATERGLSRGEPDGTLRLPVKPQSPISPLLDAIPAELTETFHYLVARLQLDGDEPLPRRLAVVAATHGEGVTVVSRALTAILANDLDVGVCLVDLNSTAGSRRRNDGGAAGLYDVLSGAVELKDALSETIDHRVSILGAGACDPADARNLVRSTSLPQIFDGLDDLFDYVIIDVPPILVGSEGIALLRHATGYLMVVRHGVTPVEQVRAASDEIGSIPSIGVVLNQCVTKIPRRLQRFFRP